MKLMILDGNSIVNRAFYGIRMLNAPDGTPTNAVYGFLTIFQRILELEQPQAVCVAFDVHAPTFRHEQYALYKAQRKPMPEELVVQMPLLKQTLDHMGIRRLELAGWEADDLLGTVAKRCEAAGWACEIVTGDKDSLQLITDTTHVCHVKTRMGQTETIEYTPEVFRAEYGFDPIHMIDLKALMGDSSDNIPGVPGIGEKTAKDLLVRFGTVADIYRDLDTLDIKPGVRKKLTEGRESAQLSFDLATIRTDAPIDFAPESAVWDRDYRPELYDWFQADYPDLHLNLHISRIYRDARRLFGRGPLNDHIWFSFQNAIENRGEAPCFWFQVGADGYGCGAGWWMPAASGVQLRRLLDHDPARGEKLLRNLDAQDAFTLSGPAYARPKGHAAEPLGRLYNQRPDPDDLRLQP